MIDFELLFKKYIYISTLEKNRFFQGSRGRGGEILH